MRLSPHIIDILSSKAHSRDFRDTRAEYIRQRVRWVALFFSVAVPLWIPVDWLTLPPHQFMAVTLARLALTLTLLAVHSCALRCRGLRAVQWLLAAVIFAPALFYAGSMQLLGEAASAGYRYMPFLVICVSSLFPLTLGCSLILLTGVTLAYLLSQLLLGQLLTLETANTLWLLVLFMGATLWVQFSQLYMLLHLYRASTLDYLTGLSNRRILLGALEKQVSGHNNGGPAPAVVMLDLDRFKRINDWHGHGVGDRVLVEVSALLRRHRHRQQVVARYGGEEFMLLLPATERAAARELAETLRREIEASPLELREGKVLQYTASLGVAVHQPGEAIDSLLERVDMALYLAKKQGRNRVVLAESQQAAH